MSSPSGGDGRPPVLQHQRSILVESLQGIKSEYDAPLVQSANLGKRASTTDTTETSASTHSDRIDEIEALINSAGDDPVEVNTGSTSVATIGAGRAKVPPANSGLGSMFSNMEFSYNGALSRDTGESGATAAAMHSSPGKTSVTEETPGEAEGDVDVLSI